MANYLRFCLEALHALLAAINTTLAADEKTAEDTIDEAIGKLSEALRPEMPFETVKPLFDSHLPVIVEGLRAHCERRLEAEKEYREIIQILTKAMADFNANNRNFTDSIFQRSEKMAEITLLEDIRSIKSGLKREIAAMQEAVRNKRAQDAKMIDLLSEQVSTLKSELESSQQAFMRDGLTGLYNEQALNRYIKSLVRPGSGLQQGFSMLVIDIDNFDKIEETYGVGLGQRVILAAGQECQNIFRSDAFLARYKRGTFVAVLPSDPRKAAVLKAKKLCRAIGAKRYQIDENLAGNTLAFTVSIGISTRKARDTAATVTGRAIRALQVARRQGANHVVTDKAVFLMFRKEGAETLADL